MRKSLPIGVVNFAELYNKNYYVIDKTSMIEEFLMRKVKVSLITRPRRFGKTSNMSMMAEFFDITKDSKGLFQHTNIAKTAYFTEMNRYPVIYLSFANCKGNADLIQKFLFESIIKAYEPYEAKFQEHSETSGLKQRVSKMYEMLQVANNIEHIASSIQTLSEFLFEVYQKRVMIFIDEYDTPFIEAHVNGCYDEIKQGFALLLQSALKDNNCLEYAMLTGIQRVAKENIFSGLNNLIVFSVKDKGYASYFGFTTEETQTLLEYYDLKLNDDVKAMYDGYHIGGFELYNPWSIINYANQKELIPYWVNTSSNAMIKQAIKESDEDFKEDYEKLLKDGNANLMVNLQTSFYEIKQSETLWGLLVNAGYLTIDKVVDIESDLYWIRIPNREVLREFKDLVAFHLNVQPRELMMLYQGLKGSDADKFIKAYQKLLLANPSYHTLCTQGRDLKDENSYHMFLLGICLYMRDEYDIISNREAGQGRCDIVLKANNNQLPSYVIEFKYTKSETNLEQLALQASNQIIEQKYDAALQGTIILVGLAHYGKEVKMNWIVKSS